MARWPTLPGPSRCSRIRVNRWRRKSWQITGITDDDVRGQHFNEELLAHSLGKCDALVAFNAPFDSGHLRRRFPYIRHPWVCAQRDYGWAAAGYLGRSQQALVQEVGGWFYPPHRASKRISKHYRS